ncbi:MAG: hypothetical protein II565_05385, partial [Fibrobacter sp.]|nr:hypothetical protein [Fibrobacter sp.]
MHSVILTTEGRKDPVKVVYYNNILVFYALLICLLGFYGVLYEFWHAAWSQMGLKRLVLAKKC